MDNELKKVEHSAIGHFKYLPQLLGFSVKKMLGSTIINCGHSSMFNIVCDSNFAEEEADEIIKQIIKEFDNLPFAWWFSPLTNPANLEKILIAYGFIVETTEYAMICDLEHFVPYTKKTPDFNIKMVSTFSDVEDFISVLSEYDDNAKAFYSKLTDPVLSLQEKLFVGYEKKIPVIIGLVYLDEDLDTSAIFSLLTKKNARGRGYGHLMMNKLMEFAKQNDKKFISLSASSDAGFRIYERLGFKTVGLLKCLEWTNK